MSERRFADLSGLGWMRGGKPVDRSQRAPVRLRLSWDPIPGTPEHAPPGADLPGPWSPLLALAPRMRAVRDLVARLRARLLSSGPNPTASLAGRPGADAHLLGPDGPQHQEG